MATLGILEERTIQKELVEAFQKDEHVIEIIEKKEQLHQVDGVVLPLTKKEEFPPLIDWLLACQKTPSVFVWVFSTISLDMEQDILMSLGANDVVTHETQLSRLSLLVKNTFLRLDHTNTIKKIPANQEVLNMKNQSIQINQVEHTLTRKEYQLLDLLYEHRGSCVTYDSLLAALWPNTLKRELYKLTNIVFHLREKLKGSEEFVIKTIRSKGYMLLTDEKHIEVPRNGI